MAAVQARPRRHGERSPLTTVLLIIAAFPGAWLAEKLLGHGPNDMFPSALDEWILPVGPISRVENLQTGGTDLFILGADGTLGRDEFLRVLYGGRVSLQVAVDLDAPRDAYRRPGGRDRGLPPGLARHDRLPTDRGLDGVPHGAPFGVALASTAGAQLNGITLEWLVGAGVVTLVLVFTVFGWFYPARIIRAKVLSLRERRSSSRRR